MPGALRARDDRSRVGILHVCRCVCAYVDFIKIFLNNKSQTICRGVGVMAAPWDTENVEQPPAALQGPCGS